MLPLVISQTNGGQAGFDQWTLNGKSYDAKNRPTRLTKGKRHRLVFDNQSDDVHPVHLHRNSFELTTVCGKPTAGVMKDVVLVKAHQKIEVDVNPLYGRAHFVSLPPTAVHGQTAVRCDLGG